MTQLSNDPKANIELLRTLCLDGTLLGELTFCQAILEGSKKDAPRLTPSLLAGKYNNLFGMKPGYTPVGTNIPGIVELLTDEYIHGKGTVIMKQPFLSNKKIEDSIAQHKKLLLGLQRYANLETATSFEEIAEMIHDDGYATDPNYPSELIAIHKEFLND